MAALVGGAAGMAGLRILCSGAGKGLLGEEANFGINAGGNSLLHSLNKASMTERLGNAATPGYEDLILSGPKLRATLSEQTTAGIRSGDDTLMHSLNRVSAIERERNVVGTALDQTVLKGSELK